MSATQINQGQRVRHSTRCWVMLMSHIFDKITAQLVQICCTLTLTTVFPPVLLNKLCKLPKKFAILNQSYLSLTIASDFQTIFKLGKTDCSLFLFIYIRHFLCKPKVKENAADFDNFKEKYREFSFQLQCKVQMRVQILKININSITIFIAVVIILM